MEAISSYLSVSDQENPKTGAYSVSFPCKHAKLSKACSSPAFFTAAGTLNFTRIVSAEEAQGVGPSGVCPYRQALGAMGHAS